MGEEDLVRYYLEGLDDASMTLAWGPDKTPEDRRRIVAAALIFGRRFEEVAGERPLEDLDEKELQRLLMGLMNAVIREFAASEGLSLDAATEFLGDVETRDYVLEFNEVLEGFAKDPDKPLVEHLRAAVEDRPEKATRSD